MKKNSSTTQFLFLALSVSIGHVVSALKGHKEALLVIDVQNCFLPGGSLNVEGGERIIPIINQLRERFEVVAFTRDWHPKHHISFASHHEGMKVFDEITLQYDKDGNLCSDPSRKTSNITEKDCSEDEIEHTVKQQVFVDHCIMDTPDSALSQELVKQKNDIVVNKGSNPEVDSYSAFFNNGGFEKTELEALLDEKQVGKVYVVGIALDFCVFWSAKDAQKLGYETFVIKDATKGIFQESMDHAVEEMTKQGIQILTSESVLGSGKEEL